MRICQKCDQPTIHSKHPFCELHKAEADKARKRSRVVKENARQKAARARDKAKQQRQCATPGCENTIGGRATYCPKCQHDRHMAAQRRYDATPRPQPTKQVTNLRWLDKFSGYAKSGQSYSEYQRTH